MRKSIKPTPEPKYPSKNKQCKYCHVTFKTPATYNGQNQDFCIPAHRKAFHKEGRKPIAAILKRQEKHMRQICREVVEQMLDQRFDSYYSSTLDREIVTPRDFRTEPRPGAARPSLPQSA